MMMRKKKQSKDAVVQMSNYQKETQGTDNSGIAMVPGGAMKNGMN